MKKQYKIINKITGEKISYHNNHELAIKKLRKLDNDNGRVVFEIQSL
jgi:hypothetical protein